MANPNPRPNSRETFKDFCLRQLGYPVIEINVDDDQVEDCIDNALQYFQDFHHDGVERWYLKHQLTADDITNQWIPITENIIGVTRIFPATASAANINMFDLKYQLRLHDLYNFTSVSYTNYVMTMQHIRTLDLLFAGEVPVRFNRHSDRLYIDWDWENDALAGQYLIIEGFIILDPETYTDVWNDRLFKKLATAHIKKQWGNNMKKYTGMQLPGGIMMNGQIYYDEAVAEIAELEQLIRSSHEEPPQFILGTWVSFFINTSIGATLWELTIHGSEIWNHIFMA